MMTPVSAGPLRDSAGFAARAYAWNLDCACAL